MSEEQSTTSSNVPMSYIKDAIIILSFLAGVAGIYVKITEQVVRLEQKVTSLEEKTKELKDSNIELQRMVLEYSGKVTTESQSLRSKFK